MNSSKKAFTLIELLVVITISWILMLVVFTPYSHYQKKAKIRIAWREISQSFYDAKSMAVSWIKEYLDLSSNEAENKSIWLYISTIEWENNFIEYYSYPYNIDEMNIIIPNNSYKKVLLQDWIRINYLSWYDSLLFFYDSINWDLKIYSFSETGHRTIVEENKIEIMYSYLNSSSLSLQKRLTYFRNTNIIDYE